MTTAQPVLGVGFDPGSRYAGVGLVWWSGRSADMPRAVFTAGIYGDWPHKWGARMRESLGVLGMQISRADFAGCVLKSAVEVWPMVRRAGSFADLAKPNRAGGRMAQAWEDLGFGYPVEVENRDWRRSFRLRAKAGDGRHRIAEASLYVQGARELLAEARPTTAVDQAEALLIAAHVARSR